MKHESIRRSNPTRGKTFYPTGATRTYNSGRGSDFAWWFAVRPAEDNFGPPMPKSSLSDAGMHRWGTARA